MIRSMIPGGCDAEECLSVFHTDHDRIVVCQHGVGEDMANGASIAIYPDEVDHLCSVLQKVLGVRNQAIANQIASHKDGRGES